MKLDYKEIREILWSADVEEALQIVLLKEYQREMQENGLMQIENDYEEGWKRLSAVLHGKQEILLEELEVLCSDEAKIAFRIAFERGQYAGFQHFFQHGAEPLTFEGFVLDKVLTMPEMKQYPDYCVVKSKVNELEAKLANQLDPFSREHLSCVTSAWKERTMAMLRYGFALGHHAAVEIIRSSAPEQAVRMALAGWETAKGTGLTD